MCSKTNSERTYFLRHLVDRTLKSTKIFRQRETSNDMVGLWSNAVERLTKIIKPSWDQTDINFLILYNHKMLIAF